jgi:formylmethanofuran dehydrogenase subunit E
MGLPALLKPSAPGWDDGETPRLRRKAAAGEATSEEGARLDKARSAAQERCLTLPLEEMFHVRELDTQPPRPARILESPVCAGCGESTMESRTRRLGGRVMCLPCFADEEQKT